MEMTVGHEGVDGELIAFIFQPLLLSQFFAKSCNGYIIHPKCMRTDKNPCKLFVEKDIVMALRLI